MDGMNYQLVNRLYFMWENCLCDICQKYVDGDTGAFCTYFEAAKELERLYAITEMDKVLTKYYE